MTSPALHVVFSLSAAPDLRKALTQAGRNDRVVAFPDDLSFGPIDPPDPLIRAAWVEAELGYADWHDIAAACESFWADALADTAQRIVWTSRRSAQDYAGFLEFLWRLGDRPCDLVDLTKLEVAARGKDGQAASPRLALSLAVLPAYQIVDNNLLDRAQALTPALRATYRASWQTLRAESAALRILSPDLVLTSAPISFFDAELLSRVTDDWQKAARIVGETMVKFLDDDLMQTGDLFLASRLRALADGGRIEAKGDLTRIMQSEVRLRRGAESQR